MENELDKIKKNFQLNCKFTSLIKLIEYIYWQR